MVGTVLRQEVYEIIQSGEAFDMEFVTADRRRGTGGDLIVCEGWMILRKDDRSPVTDDRPDEEDNPSSAILQPSSKDPHHALNGTVNVFNPANPGYHPITVHYELIQVFNGKRVIN